MSIKGLISSIMAQPMPVGQPTRQIVVLKSRYNIHGDGMTDQNNKIFADIDFSECPGWYIHRFKELHGKFSTASSGSYFLNFHYQYHYPRRAGKTTFILKAMYHLDGLTRDPNSDVNVDYMYYVGPRAEMGRMLAKTYMDTYAENPPFKHYGNFDAIDKYIHLGSNLNSRQFSENDTHLIFLDELSPTQEGLFRNSKFFNLRKCVFYQMGTQV